MSASDTSDWTPFQLILLLTVLPSLFDISNYALFSLNGYGG